MLFFIFDSQEERKKYGGSKFIEMQFCKLSTGTKTKDIVAVSSIKNWQNDSLYIYEEDVFYKEYSRIFDSGIYNNLKSGMVDIYGINYYAPSCIDSLVEKICKKKPADHESLLEWLDKAKEYNGFYILGI